MKRFDELTDRGVTRRINMLLKNEHQNLDDNIIQMCYWILDDEKCNRERNVENLRDYVFRNTNNFSRYKIQILLKYLN